MRKYFSSEPEIAYFIYSAIMLVVWGWVFIPVPWEVGPGGGDAALGLGPLSIPWLIWTTWAPVYIWRAVRDWRAKGIFPTLFKLIVYVIAILFLASFIALLAYQISAFQSRMGGIN